MSDIIGIMGNSVRQVHNNIVYIDRDTGYLNKTRYSTKLSLLILINKTYKSSSDCNATRTIAGFKLLCLLSTVFL